MALARRGAAALLALARASPRGSGCPRAPRAPLWAQRQLRGPPAVVPGVSAAAAWARRAASGTADEKSSELVSSKAANTGVLAAQGRGELVSSKSANTGVLAGAVAGRIRDDGRCTISAVGPVACHLALKAIVIAEQYLQETHTGQHLAFTPEKFVVPERGAPSGRTTETSVLKLHVRPLPGATDTSAPELFAASDTNPGLLAGSLAKRIETDGSTVVSGMGSHAVSKVLKALLVAETYLERRGKLDGKTIAATVRNEAFRENDEERKRLVLRCSLAPSLKP